MSKCLCRLEHFAWNYVMWHCCDRVETGLPSRVRATKSISAKWDRRCRCPTIMVASTFCPHQRDPLTKTAWRAFQGSRLDRDKYVSYRDESLFPGLTSEWQIINYCAHVYYKKKTKNKWLGMMSNTNDTNFGSTLCQKSLCDRHFIHFYNGFSWVNKIEQVQILASESPTYC